MCAAPLGNKFWLIRSSHGRKPIFKTPDELEKACLEYFEWTENNPLKEQKAFHSNGVITKTTVNKMRAMTLSGLCIFLDIDDDSWKNYKKKNKGFFGVCSNVEKIIYNQKFTGASADLLNASIIARELGLADKVDNTHAGDPSNPIKHQHKWEIEFIEPKQQHTEGEEP